MHHVYVRPPLNCVSLMYEFLKNSYIKNFDLGPAFLQDRGVLIGLVFLVVL